MILCLTKTADGPVQLTFTRSDGSTTSRPVSPLFVAHELMHYAVELTLGLDSGLLGLIAGGRSVADFDAAARNWLPLEAHHAEAIVGALEAEVAGSANEEDFAHNLKAVCDDVGVPVPAPISEELLQQVRQEFKTLAARWRSLPDGGALELQWRERV